MKRILLLVLLMSFVFTGCISVKDDKPDNDEINVSEEEIDVPEKETEKEQSDESQEKEPSDEVLKEEPADVPEEKPVEKPIEPEIPADTINSLPNDNNGWGFVKKKGTFPEFTKGQMDMMAKYGCIYAGNKSEKVLYLTFDEGYENGYTGAILDTLKEKGVPATFFITGPYLEKNSDLISRMVAEGHIVGNHTVNHPNMPSKGTKEAMQEEILNLDRRFFELYGRHMTYFRPPEGAYSERSLAATNELGYKTVLWSFAYKDWETDNQKGADYAYESVVPYLHNGCVILLHAVSKDNTEALGRIIDAARAEGYVFKSLDEYKY